MNEGRVVGIIGYFTDTGRHVSYEEIVEEIRQQVLDRKYKVVTILGDPVVMEGGLLRTNIARSGVMVVEPGEREREWLGRRITRGFDDDQLEHFRDLILEARAHRVEAAVVCHPKIMETMETLALGLPILDASRVAVFV
jgi:aspartate/glutamate racemase